MFITRGDDSHSPRENVVDNVNIKLPLTLPLSKNVEISFSSLNRSKGRQYTKPIALVKLLNVLLPGVVSLEAGLLDFGDDRIN